MGNVIIWSKVGCPACRKAKLFFIEKGMNYEERIIGEKYSYEDFQEMVPNAKTVPQIFIDDKHIGGWSDLQEYYNY